MKKIIFFVFVLFIAFFLGCGDEVTINLTDIFGCKVEETDLGATISCPDGSIAFVINGSTGPIGSQGPSGSDGIDGNNGVDGIDGGSCHVEEFNGCARIFCDDGSEAVVCPDDDPPCDRPNPPGWCRR